MDISEIKIEALRHKTLGSLIKNNEDVFKFILNNGMYDEVCSHFGNKIKPRGYWNEITVRTHAKECKNRKDFQAKYDSGYRLAKQLNIIDELFGKINKPDVKFWTEDRIIDAALKVKNKKEFQEKFGEAYFSAKRLNILDELFDNHLKKDRPIWNKENILKIYDPNETKMQFIKKSASAASAAKIWEFGMI